MKLKNLDGGKLKRDSKALIMTKLKTKIVTKLKTPIALLSNCDKTQIGTKLKFGHNSKTQNVTKLKL